MNCPYCSTELIIINDELYCQICQTTINCDYMTAEIDEDNVNTQNIATRNVNSEDMFSSYLDGEEYATAANDIYNRYLQYTKTNVRGAHKKRILAACAYIAKINININFDFTHENAMEVFGIPKSDESKFKKDINELILHLNLLSDKTQIRSYFNTVAKNFVIEDREGDFELLNWINENGYCRNLSMISKCAGIICRNMNIDDCVERVNLKKTTLEDAIISTRKALEHYSK